MIVLNTKCQGKMDNPPPDMSGQVNRQWLIERLHRTGPPEGPDPYIGVEFHRPPTMLDPRGWFQEIFTHRRDETQVARHIYISATDPGVIKGWHLHKIQTDRFWPIQGRAMVALWDTRPTTPDSKPLVITLDARTPGLLIIPPYVAHGWRALGNEQLRILNICSHVYDGTDEYRCPPTDPVWENGPVYDWKVHNG